MSEDFEQERPTNLQTAAVYVKNSNTKEESNETYDLESLHLKKRELKKNQLFLAPRK